MTLDALVRNSASRAPNSLAIKGSNECYTYLELDLLSNRFARVLFELGVHKGDRVGIWLDKSPCAVAIMQGVLRLGAIYVPLDPLSPASRIGAILRDCALRVLVSTQKRVESVLKEDLSYIRPLCIDHVEQWSNVLAQNGEPGDWFTPTDDDIAYILYTSGSTGKPKGVCVSHRNALAFIEWAAKELQVKPSDRFSNHAPFHFDLSVLDLYVPFLTGASVFLIPDEMSYVPRRLVEFILQEGITIWYSVPSVLVLMMELGGLCGLEMIPLRAILFAGEPFPSKYLRRLYERWSTIRFLNLYGPTETNVCTFFEVRQIESNRTQPVPIGQACSGNQVWALKDDATVVKPGEVGELMVVGPTVMYGYWGQPPHGNKPYATGDIVRLEDDGNYTYIGRRDHMVKVRGNRVELGEIEAVLMEHPAIRAVAVAVCGSGMDTRLIAFVVSSGNSPPSLLDVKRHCAERLPRYMIIDAVEPLESLPRTRNGKIDRLTLTQWSAKHHIGGK